MNDFKTAKLDNKDILKDSTSGIYYTFKEWRKLSTSDESQNIDGMHGRTISPTYARARIITLEGISDRLWNENDYSSILYLEELFSLQWNPWTLKKRELYIKDIYDREWKIDVKIKEPLEILEWDDSFIWSHWRWRVVLESLEDPIYKSLDEIMVSGGEWVFLWFTFPFSFSKAWNESWSIIECQSTWNIDTPARIEISAKKDLTWSLKIQNITNDTYFIINTELSSDDVLIIDSNYETLTKNWENILGNREPWSIWPTISRSTKFVVNDEDGNNSPESFDVKIYFNNSLI